MPALITSIPPKELKRTHHGIEIGEIYQKICIDSWREAGFQIYSVNNDQELKKNENAHEEIIFYTVKSDGTIFSGKPLVCFNDLLDCGYSTKEDIIAFTNADIFFSDVQKIAKIAKKIIPGKAIFSRRINVENIKERKGSTYIWGYDLLILHKNDLDAIRTRQEMFFGEPWWDYYVLCMLFLNKIYVETFDSSYILHLSHKEAFEKKRWEEIGIHTLQELQNKKTPSINKLFKTRAEKNVILMKEILNKVKPIDGTILHVFAKELILLSQRIGFKKSSKAQIKKACIHLERKIK
jgi:hypothetical protein